VLREIWTKAPLIDLSLFRERTFTLAVLCKSIFMITFGAVISLLANYMVTTRQYPRTTTGLVFLPGALAMGAALVLSGLIGMRWSRKVRLVLGMAGLAFATWQLTIIDLYTDKFLIGLYFTLWGASAGLMLPPVIVLPMEGLTQPQVVSSASIKNMVRELPSTIGSLLFAILLTRRSDAHFDQMRQKILPNRAVVEDVNRGLADHLTQHGSSGPRLHEQAGDVIGTYIHANARAFADETMLYYLALLCVIGVGLALLIRPAKSA
jgi:DHA2 family multidrug resistance protein